MNRRIIALSFMLTLCTMLFSASISFSGGKSTLIMREGEKSVSLTEGAEVISGSMKITASSITLSGEDWKEIESRGKIEITDSERGISIKTSILWFDRIDEILVISSFFELDDIPDQLYAQAGSLRYDMKNEKLEMGMQVTLMKVADGEVMKCSSESVVFDRNSGILSLLGGARVEWKGDSYEAEMITVDTSDNTISLSGRIKGTING